ncbi:hypothetical protein ABRY95_13745 [Castellaniella ginsengisoli]|uniref:Extracellular solute-binding protein n=1 Tax=Castellaniella ginsengisoli TaxID=546114 RepID=A0AB39H7C1_9BURK
MAINLDDRYPGRAGGKTLDYPQGSFKNRTSPNAQDGTFLEQDWANDQLAFFQALMSDAGMAANNVVDTARASQYFDALVQTIRSQAIPGMTFAEVDALVDDQGPIIVTDMGCMPWVWTETAYFEGYRNPLCATIPQHFAATARAWEMPVTGGVWSESDPKQRRLIAWFREQGLTVASESWAKGWGRIADLGGGDWKAPDLQDVFLRMAGTDADTANARTTGTYQADALQNITGTTGRYWGVDATPSDSGAFAYTNKTTSQLSSTSGPAYPSRSSFDASRVARTSTETRSASSAVAPVILV